MWIARRPASPCSNRPDLQDFLPESGYHLLTLVRGQLQALLHGRFEFLSFAGTAQKSRQIGQMVGGVHDLG